MQHGGPAVASSGSEKSCHLELPAKRSSLQPAGVFAQSHDSNFDFYQTLCTVFDQ